jgi:thiamine biosynthesis lipoprotein
MYYHEFRAMNTAILLGAEGNLQRVREGFYEVEGLVLSYEKRFTRFSQDSELSALNRSTGQWFEVSPEMVEIMRLALDYYQRTGGLFNPAVLQVLEQVGYDHSMEEIQPDGIQPDSIRLDGIWAGKITSGAKAGNLENHKEVPDFGLTSVDPLRRAVKLPHGLRIDLGGIAKGWIAEKAAWRLSQYASACVVDAGGDLFTLGLPDEGVWRVALEDPFAPSRDLAVLSVVSGAIATSSVMRRRWSRGGHEYHHLIDPRTSQPAESIWVSVTAAADHTAWAEVLAKSLLIAGPDEAYKLAIYDPAACFIAVDKNGKIWGSPNSGRLLQEQDTVLRGTFSKWANTKSFAGSLFAKKRPAQGGLSQY